MTRTHCGKVMTHGVALKPDISDRSNYKLGWRIGNAVIALDLSSGALQTCLKCHVCGYSITKGKT